MAKKKYRYSILTYIVGDYELVHEVKNPKPDVEYVMVTDNPYLTSKTWKVKYVKNEHPEDPFDLGHKIRFNPFDYVKSDIVIRIDGSMGIVGDTDPLVEEFNKGNYAACVMIHPARNTMLDEYQCWTTYRKYDAKQANLILLFMARMYNYEAKKYKGLYQANFIIQRRDKMNLDWNRLTYATLKYLAPEGKQIERINQTISSMILNKYFSSRKIMPVSEKICNGSIFTWYKHKTNTIIDTAGKILIEPYLFNKPVKTLF